MSKKGDLFLVFTFAPKCIVCEVESLPTWEILYRRSSVSKKRRLFPRRGPARANTIGRRYWQNTTFSILIIKCGTGTNWRRPERSSFLRSSGPGAAKTAAFEKGNGYYIVTPAPFNEIISQVHWKVTKNHSHRSRTNKNESFSWKKRCIIWTIFCVIYLFIFSPTLLEATRAQHFARI